jgi:hypothetical protein
VAAIKAESMLLQKHFIAGAKKYEISAASVRSECAMPLE